MPWSTKWEEPVVSKFEKEVQADIAEANKNLEDNDFVSLDEFKKELLADDWSSPNILLKFECVECKSEFDCNTTSFKILCDSAKAAGWQMKWHDVGYSCYCPKHKE